MALNPKQTRFVEEYLIDLNATQAATRAGYSSDTARSIASELLTKPDIQDAVQEAQRVRSERVGLNAADVLAELKKLVHCDPRRLFDREGNLIPIHELPDDIAAAIAGVEVEERMVGKDEDAVLVRTRKVRLTPKMPAIDSAMKHLGVAGADKLEHSGSVGVVTTYRIPDNGRDTAINEQDASQ